MEKALLNDARRDLLQYCSCSSPVAYRDGRVRQRIERKIVVTINIECGFEGCKCFLVAMESGQCIATSHEDIRALGLKRECAVICAKGSLNCSVVSIYLGQGVAVID